VLRLEGLSALVMRAGLAYDSDAAREAASALSGPIAARAQATYHALPGGKHAGLRVSPTIAFANDAASARRLGLPVAGLSPIETIALYGAREDGGFGRLLSDDARAGLAALGYGGEAIAELASHIEGRRTLKGAPGVSLDALAAKGLTEPALNAIEEAAQDALSLRAAVHPLVIGPEFCEDVLKLPPDVAAGKRGDLVLAEAERHQEIAALAGGHVGRELQYVLAELGPDHERMHSCAKRKRVLCSFFDRIERGLSEPLCGERIEADARRALQRAAPFDVRREFGNGRAVVTERGEARARGWRVWPPAQR
jgi:hypothetical protein